MKAPILCGLGLGAVSLVALTATVAPAASGQQSNRPQPQGSSASSLVHSHPASPGACYDQRINDNGIGIVSQNFENAFNAYDNRAADDFTLDEACTVTEVRVDGVYFNGSGPARSVHVTFYHDNEGTPGQVISGQKYSPYTDMGFGSFDITLKRAVRLDPGHYWVSVKVNMRFDTGGEWGWNTNNPVNGVPSQWRNVRNGFGTGCTTYTTTTVCIPSGEGGDFSFALIQ